MSWLKLDDSMPEHPKVAALSDTAFRHHLGGLAYCARLMTDGFIPAKIAGEITTQKTLGELSVEQVPGMAPLWQKADRGWLIHDYLDYNPSRDEIQSQRESRSRAGRKGASSRYGTSDSKRNGTSDSKSHDTRTSSANDNADAPVPVPSRSTATAEESRKQRPRTKHGDGTDQRALDLDPAIALLLDDNLAAKLKPSQIAIVNQAWHADSHELRHSLADIEAAENPVAMLVSIAKRILPPDEQTPAERTATTNSKHAAAVARCKQLYHDATTNDGDTPQIAYDWLLNEYRHDPSIVTEAIGPPPPSSSPPSTREDVPF